VAKYIGTKDKNFAAKLTSLQAPLLSAATVGRFSGRYV
jgi:hypothetical protein